MNKNPDKLLTSLKEAGYGLTILTAEGYHNKLILLVIKRKNLKEVLEIIESNYPNAFVSIQETQSVKGGIFPPRMKIHKQILRRNHKMK